MKLLLVVLSAACLLVGRPARAEDKAVDAAAGDVKQLIEQLGDGEYAKREEAAKRLKAIGKPALPALREALKGDDPEVVTRAQTLIKRIEVRPLPGGDPGGVNGLVQATRMRMSVKDGNRVLEVTEEGRDIKITDGPDGVSMSVTGLVDGQRTTEEYAAKDAEQLKDENPEAYALYQRWAGGPAGAGLIFGGGQARFGGGGVGQIIINNGPVMQITPDELDLLRERLEKQMRDAKLTDEQKAEVRDGLDKVVNARNNGGRAVAMDGYTQASDEFRKVLDQHKLDAGDLLPPPAKTRLGVSILTEEGRLVINTIGEKSRAQRVGLQSGDVIRKIDGKEVGTVTALRKAVGAKEKGLVVEVTRGGEDLKLEEKDEPAAAK
jgi:hypothetical protein